MQYTLPERQRPVRKRESKMPETGFFPTSLKVASSVFQESNFASETFLSPQNVSVFYYYVLRTRKKKKATAFFPPTHIYVDVIFFFGERSSIEKKKLFCLFLPLVS